VGRRPHARQRGGPGAQQHQGRDGLGAGIRQREELRAAPREVRPLDPQVPQQADEALRRREVDRRCYRRHRCPFPAAWSSAPGRPARTMPPGRRPVKRRPAARDSGVLTVFFLVVNEGYLATGPDTPTPIPSDTT
jgi:hypothetical protein